MGMANGRKWSNIRKAFRQTMSNISADNSIDNIAVSLDQWEKEVLDIKGKNGEIVNLCELVGKIFDSI